MTINVKLSLYGPAELEAFAVFCNAVATARRAEPDTPAALAGLAGIVGGIDRGNNGWRVASYTPEAEPPQEAQDAKTETVEGDAPTPTAPKRTRKAKAVEKTDAEAETSKPSTGGTTVAVNPQVAEDPPEVAAQDAADEAAETAAAKPDGAAPTLDDIRNVLGLYQKVYGLPATMTDGPLILQEVCGEGVNKVSSVPEDKIADVIAALKKAGNENRFGRQKVAS